MKLPALVVAYFVLASEVFAFVVPQSNVQYSEVPTEQQSFFGQHSLSVFQNPGGDYTSFYFDSSFDSIRNELTLTPVTWNIDEEADFYFAPLNSVFSAQTIAAAAFRRLFVLDNPYALTISNIRDPRVFWLGINTGIGFTTGVPHRDVFGWVKLQYLPETNTFNMLDNTMSYGEAGIIIGHDIAVLPEAGTVLFGTSDMLGILMRRPRKFVLGLGRNSRLLP